MNNFYILLRGYFPGLASNNHCLGWLKSFDELGVKATVVNIRPNDDFERMPEIYRNLKIANLWDNPFCRVKNRLLRYLIHQINVWRFTRMVKQGDTVWVYDLPEAIIRLANNRGLHVYNEVTEHPENGVKTSSDKKYVDKRVNAIKQIEGLFVISTRIKKAYIERGIDENKIHIINMIVDESRFEGLQKQGNERTIVHCGNFHGSEGEASHLIKSFSLVHKKYPDYKIIMIGPSPQQEVDSVLGLVERLGLQNSVIFTGRKYPDEVPQLLKNASILALDRPDSLQAQNGFPTKLGEYLMTENPVCVTNVGDIPLFLKNGVNAMVAEHDNEEDFASKIIWLIEHPQEASIIGKRGKEVALAHFNPMIEAKKMLKYMNMN